MSFLKLHWRMIVFVAVCVASVASSVWAVTAGSSVTEQMESISRLLGTARGAQNQSVNTTVIDDRRKQIQQLNESSEKALDTALSMQRYSAFHRHSPNDALVPRVPLVEDVLPKPVSGGKAIAFRNAYRDEFVKLRERLHARGEPTPDDVTQQRERLRQLDEGGGEDSERSPWAAAVKPSSGGTIEKGDPKSLLEALRQNPASRAADEIAHRCWMYAGRDAFFRHSIADDTGTPNATAIWQAQMSLWIQQDMAEGLARCNERRAAEYRAKGQTDRLWVGHMPVKHLKRCLIADRLGRRGGSPGLHTAPSFTGIENNDQLFMVPIRLELVVEEAALPTILDSLCRVGFYTPTQIITAAVPPNPIQEGFVYGDDPVIGVEIELEGYYFRKVFDPWIPEDIKPILSRPGAEEEMER